MNPNSEPALRADLIALSALPFNTLTPAQKGRVTRCINRLRDLGLDPVRIISEAPQC